MDNRLDAIKNLNEGAQERIAEVTHKFIRIDHELRGMLKSPVSPALNRSIALTRTHLEMTLDYFIKSIKLQYEKK